MAAVPSAQIIHPHASQGQALAGVSRRGFAAAPVATEPLLRCPQMRKLVALTLLALNLSGGAAAMYEIERPTPALACGGC
jgi:hypothetical protein